jgi:hypothetical protein
VQGFFGAAPPGRARLTDARCYLAPVDAESGEPQACDVCGRHMLSGERTREYVTPNDDHRAVCDLCRAKAHGAGWVRADLAEHQRPKEEAQDRPRRRLRWRPRVKLVREREPRESDGGGDRGGTAVQQRRTGASQRRTGVTQRRPGSPETPERRIRRALDRFNSSEHRRTVAGLTRSLGNPRVAAITPAEAPDQVRLTVAWDLSWYQWEVELSEEEIAVHSLGTGKEVSELGAADRAWNAWAGEDGRLQLGASGNGDGEVPAPDDAG